MPPALVDLKGHLTPAGLSALARAPVGKAPSDLAAHVASCPRCQEGMLAGAVVGTAPPRERRAPPPSWRIWVVFVAGLAALFAILFATRNLR